MGPGASSEAAVHSHHAQVWWLCGGQGVEGCREQELFLGKAVCDLVTEGGGGRLLQS